MLLSKQLIAEAYETITPHIRQTPVVEIAGTELGLDEATKLYLKLEHLQHSGTFKARGALSFMLKERLNPVGVVAASGGNHGSAVAWAAQKLGYNAKIFVPSIAPEAKCDRMRSYGAKVEVAGPTFAEALDKSREYAETTGASFIHPYDDQNVIAGGGSVAAEFTTQLDKPLTNLLVACGGGGLAGGCATWLGKTAPIIACETFDTPTFAEAKRIGQPVTVSVTGVAADALGVVTVGVNGFAALLQNNATSVLVTDEDVMAAKDWLWENVRLVVEPSAAVPLAAILSGAWKPEPASTLGIILCGANVDLCS